MSISFDKNDTNHEIATMIKDGKVEKIYVNDIDDIPEGEQRLTKIRLNNDSDYFFPSITDYKTGDNMRVYVCGPSRSGKSTFIRNFIIHFKEKYPKSKVLLFSSKKEDPMLDDLNIERVNISDDMLVNQMTLEEIAAMSRPSLCVFDDIQDFQSKKINFEIARLRNEVMRNGGSYNIYSLYVWHEPADYYNTKYQISEANRIVIFPRRAGEGAYDYLMTKYLKLNKNIQNMLTRMKSRFCVINKDYPRYVMTDKYIILI